MTILQEFPIEERGPVKLDSLLVLLNHCYHRRGYFVRAKLAHNLFCQDLGHHAYYFFLVVSRALIEPLGLRVLDSWTNMMATTVDVMDIIELTAEESA